MTLDSIRNSCDVYIFNREPLDHIIRGRTTSPHEDTVKMESNNNVAALLHQVKSNSQKHSNLLRIDFTLPGALRRYTLQALILASMSSPLVWEIETDGNH